MSVEAENEQYLFNPEALGWICDVLEIEESVTVQVDYDYAHTGDAADLGYDASSTAVAIGAHVLNEDGTHWILIHPAVDNESALNDEKFVSEFTHALLHELVHAHQSERYQNWHEIYRELPIYFELQADKAADMLLEEAMKRELINTSLAVKEEEV